jgi:DNA polymerase III epsilon subunit-like protein
MIKIDKRKNYYLTIDTETANGLDDALVYDIGGAIHDKKGRVYETFSFVIYDVFVGMKDLMQTAYYADKIPMYEDDLRAGTRKMVTYLTAKKHIKRLCEKYNVRAIIAHNARFDYRATNTTQRYLTCSKYRYFLPYGLPIYDTLKMARDTIGKQKTYIQWCKNNGYMVNNNRPRLTAEILYRYISGNNSFVEEHTGLEDVLIEKEIFAKCMRQHKKMEKRLFKD